jgi:hypothetical protein
MRQDLRISDRNLVATPCFLSMNAHDLDPTLTNNFTDPGDSLDSHFKCNT